MLKKFLLYIFTFLIFFTAVNTEAKFYSESFAPESSIKRRAFNAPDKISTDIHKLTAYLTKPFNNNYDKLKVIAYWISSHIAYDMYRLEGKLYLQNNYDILKAKIGICADFADLFQRMASIANIKSVRKLSGYVVATNRLGKYSKKELRADNAHAWNIASYNGRKFYIDTTFMAPMRIGRNEKKYTSLHHKFAISKRNRASKHEIDTNINTFYFDFTNKQEVHEKQKMHLERSLIRSRK